MRRVSIALVLLLLAACDRQTPVAPEHRPVSAAALSKIREPAVAGLFYPKEPAELAKAVEACIADAKPEPIVELKALICPHAGYRYSGPVAGYSYRQLVGREYRTVVLLAPSHYFPLQGASVSSADAFRTPLGDVPISAKAKALAALPPFIAEPHAQIRRPEWASESSRTAPAEGEDTPDTWEHSDEVQVPFLQKSLGSFDLLPVVMGPCDPAAAAKALMTQLDDQTLIVASSDLSHYHPYDEARALDAACMKAICDMDIEAMKNCEACGIMPILTLMHVAKAKGWKPMLLDCRNSGDTTGDKSRGVVGYSAIAFYVPQPEAYSAAERRAMLELARRTLTEVVASNRVPAVDVAAFPASLREKKGCFVTLTEGGQLRGCIGHILPQAPLCRAVAENAFNAAMRDTRFTPVKPDELDRIDIEISVLTVPQPLEFKSPEELLARLVPYRDGVVLQLGGSGATYLPQVWEQIPDKEAFLSHLSEKAGCPPEQWRGPGTKVSTYRVEAFKEKE